MACQLNAQRREIRMECEMLALQDLVAGGLAECDSQAPCPLLIQNGLRKNERLLAFRKE